MSGLRRPRILVIAGMDPTANAGIMADVRAIHFRGGHAVCAISAFTEQSNAGVRHVWPVDDEVFKAQIACAIASGKIDAIKVGLLANAASVRSVAAALKDIAQKNIAPKDINVPMVPMVIDPVTHAHGGGSLHVEDGVMKTMEGALFCRSRLITPNIEEARVLSGMTIDSFQGQIKAARNLARRFKSAVLIKGGHSLGSTIMDVLAESDTEVKVWKSRRILGAHQRGTGCALASVAALELARGQNLQTAVKRARFHVRALLRDVSLCGLERNESGKL